MSASLVSTVAPEGTVSIYHTGFGMTLLELVCAAGASPEIRIAAAVSLKNFVKTNWVRARVALLISCLMKSRLLR